MATTTPELSELPASPSGATTGQSAGTGITPDLPQGAARSTSRGKAALRRLLSSRGFVLGLAAASLALVGQKLIVEMMPGAVLLSIRWYAAAIALMVVAWIGTYKNKSLLLSPAASWVRKKTARPRVTRAGLLVGGRYVLALAALDLNLYGASQIRQDYYSSPGAIAWALSLLLLAAAFVGYRPGAERAAAEPSLDVEDRTDWKLPRKVEVALFLLLVVVGAALRFYRLDDWSLGMHGDEGEFGLASLSILQDKPMPLFATNWLGHPNLSFWVVALTMQLFGTDLFGLRAFPALLGTLMLLPTYLLVRMWFGVRMALIATALLAVSEVAIHFSKLGLNNIVTPFCLVLGFCFLFHGIRTKSMLSFVLGGYAHMATLYFYYGGRLSPAIVAAVLAYLFLLVPLLQLPARYRQARRANKGGQGLAALRSATAYQVAVVRQYAAQLFVFAVASVCIASPFAAYYLDHLPEFNSRTNDYIVFNNPGRITAGVPEHGPLYVGLRLPREDDVYPFSPVVFENTPLSIKVAEDGWWPKVLWGQLNVTLSILTYRRDYEAFYPTGKPLTNPLETPLVILGIAWALWRWRDSRMAVLSIWFWATVIVGGVLTVPAPYAARLVGIIPLLAIFAAIPVNKVLAELVRLVSAAGAKQVVQTGVEGGRRPVVTRARAAPRRLVGSVQALGALAAVVLVAYIGQQNYNDYYVRFPSTYPSPVSMAAAHFVKKMNREADAAGRPRPVFYNLGLGMAPLQGLYFDYGVNRFLNRGTSRVEVTSLEGDLPPAHDEGRDVIFMLWGSNIQHLPAIQAEFPRGTAREFRYGEGSTSLVIFTYYTVKKENLGKSR